MFHVKCGRTHRLDSFDGFLRWKLCFKRSGKNRWSFRAAFRRSLVGFLDILPQAASFQDCGGPLMAVKAEVVPNAPPSLGNRAVFVQVDLLVLEATYETSFLAYSPHFF